jgi:hypothetical protein
VYRKLKYEQSDILLAQKRATIAIACGVLKCGEGESDARERVFVGCVKVVRIGVVLLDGVTKQCYNE